MKGLCLVCDTCRIKMPYPSRGLRRFIEDHHGCDPDVGVRLVKINSWKISKYLDITKSREQENEKNI